MAADRAFIAFVCDQLMTWAGVASRRMFSGHGIFRAGTMFALVHADTLYFRTDGGNRDDFTASGMEPFRYSRAGRSVALGYHEVPAEILDEPDMLGQWAQKAYEAALRSAVSRSGGRRRAGMARRRWA